MVGWLVGSLVLRMVVVKSDDSSDRWMDGWLVGEKLL